MINLKNLILAVIISIVAGIAAADLSFFGLLWQYHHAGAPGEALIYIVNNHYTGILAASFGLSIGAGIFAFYWELKERFEK
jgi:hypothetical protein